MKNQMKRRDFLQLALAGGALCIGRPGISGAIIPPQKPKLISPGCRGTKVRVARIYMGSPDGLWPEPGMNFQDEIRLYESRFLELKEELSDVLFTVDELVTAPEQVGRIQNGLKDVDGILLIHLNLGIRPILDEILGAGKPTLVFAVPYSGHEWADFGAMRKQEPGSKMECILTSDYRQLAAAIRPFRAIHHLREAKILNLSTNPSAEYALGVKNKFGTEIQPIGLKKMVDAYRAVPDSEARAEADRWLQGAVQIVEPSREDVFKSCKAALAFENLLNEENATVMTVDCYGSMHRPFCQSYAYPCLGFTRLNDMGLGGICESDLESAMTHILFQGLAGRPGFISDPTLDESNGSIVLAHCLGTTRMDGPDRPAAPYKLRTIMERQEGVVPQVQMKLGQKVTQARLVGMDFLPFFTGEIIDTPDIDRGCRTKITVKVDGNIESLWKNWSNGLHRVTCYGDISRELGHFCRFQGIRMVNEAA